MFKLPSHWVFYVVALLVATTGGVLFNHYNDAYRLRIYCPTESWHRELPWDYKELFGEGADLVQESFFYTQNVASVVSMSQTVDVFTSTDRVPFEAGFESALKERTSTVRSCGSVRTDDDTWTCFEWYKTVEDVPLRNRSYLSGRGITKVVVTFSSADENFRKFGNPERWLREFVEWEGPSIFHAL